MRNILILKYWARKAKFHDTSRYLADHVSCNRIFFSCNMIRHSQKKHQHNLFNLPNHRTNKATDEIIVHSFVCMDSRSSRFQRAGFVAVFVQFWGMCIDFPPCEKLAWTLQCCKSKLTARFLHLRMALIETSIDAKTSRRHLWAATLKQRRYVMMKHIRRQYRVRLSPVVVALAPKINRDAVQT